MVCYPINTYIDDGSWSRYFRVSCHFWIQRVLLPIVVIVGVIGNLVTIVVLTRKRMSCSTNTYLTALAVADILFLVFSLILSFENYPNIRHLDYLPYWKYWRFGLWFTDATSGVSIWLTVSFTLERYIAVCHPLKGRVMCTESRARRVIVFVFILCPLLTITTPFEWKIEVHSNSTASSIPSVLTCSTNLGKNEFYRNFFYWFSAMLFVFVPLVILAILNSFLISAVQQSKTHRTNLTQVRSLYREKQENKMTMTLVAVVFLFLICQTPMAVTLIVKIFYDPKPNTLGDNMLGALGTIWNFLVAVNAASNFVMYCVMSDKYRRTLMLTFFPSFVYRHHQTGTVTSNTSFRLSSERRSPFS
ncbi:hypothetical protein AAG570_006892 [Ranatra chinensis]|uniref:G-protein coupled receptors family 1 profile domain-containing protein n=1 Tax=Ranatra chinensis TaxID=642074 RepID=A0ABD0YVL8_9HEMI